MKHPPPRTRLLHVMACLIALLPVAACSSGFGSDVERLERLTREHAGVAAVRINSFDSYVQGRYVYVTVELAASATADEIARVAEDTVGELAGERFADADSDARFEWSGSVLEIDQVEFPTGALDAEARAWAASAASRPTDVYINSSWETDAPYRRGVVVAIEQAAAPDRISATFRELANLPFPPAEASWTVAVPDPTLDEPEPVAGLYTSTYHFLGDLPADPVLPVLEAIAEVRLLAGPGDAARVAVDATPARVAVHVDMTIAELRHVPCNEIEARIAGTSADRLVEEYLERLEASGLSYELTATVCKPERFVEISGGP